MYGQRWSRKVNWTPSRDNSIPLCPIPCPQVMWSTWSILLVYGPNSILQSWNAFLTRSHLMSCRILQSDVTLHFAENLQFAAAVPTVVSSAQKMSCQNSVLVLQSSNRNFCGHMSIDAFQSHDVSALPHKRLGVEPMSILVSIPCGYFTTIHCSAPKPCTYVLPERLTGQSSTGVYHSPVVRYLCGGLWLTPNHMTNRWEYLRVVWIDCHEHFRTIIDHIGKQWWLSWISSSS